MNRIDVVDGRKLDILIRSSFTKISRKDARPMLKIYMLFIRIYVENDVAKTWRMRSSQNSH